eukprot:m.289619 g.289619  ORF g.289619 m.289619 type:complete len:113 (+) comp12157_c0_seq1:60-398(+)
MSDEGMITEIDGVDEEILTETILERIVGLQEMLPESLVKTASWTSWGVHKALRASGTALWVIATTCVVVFLPVIYEHEHDQNAAAMARTTQTRQMSQDLLMQGPGAVPMPPQ